MITKNYKKILKIIPILMPTNTKSGTYDTITMVNGSTKTISPAYMFNTSSPVAMCSSSNSLRTSKNYGGLTIGSGSTPATENDYELESPIFNNNISLSILSEKFYVENSTYYSETSLTLTNSTSNDITIREIGIVNQISPNGDASTKFLADRTVFETPIILVSGEATPIKYTIKVDWDI